MFRQSIPLTLCTLSSVYIHGVNGGFIHPMTPQLPTSTYGMELKLEPVVALDRRRR